jgi:hypothetical protein
MRIKILWDICGRKMTRINKTEKQGLREKEEKGVITACFSVASPHFRTRVSSLPGCRLQINMTVTCYPVA